MIYQFLFLIPAAYLIGATICRIGVMSPKTTKKKWSLVYIGMAAWSGSLMVDIIQHPHDINTRDLLGVLALAMYMHMTAPRWIGGVPEVARKTS